MTTKALPFPEVFLDSSDVCQATGQCDCNDCDCACAESANPAAKRALPAGLAGRNVHLASASVSLPLTETYALHYGPFQRPAVLNLPAQALLAQASAGMTLRWADQPTQRALEALWGACVLISADQPAPRPADTSDMLVAWLTITNECPLRCDYCYIPPRGQSASSAMARAIVGATMRSASAHHHARVKFKYGGGEPLLKWPIVAEAHTHARQEAARFGLGLEGVVLSNGVLLTPAILEQMRSLDLRLMISLDGLGSAHDAQRHYANGAGSFTAVERNIRLALEHGIVPDISITISGRNAVQLPNVVGWVLDHNLPFGLNLYRENDCSAGCDDLKGGDEQLLQGLLAAYKVIEQNLPRRSLLGALADRANLSHPHLKTCGAGDHYLAFDCDGRAAKCQMQLGMVVTTADEPDPLSGARGASQGLQNLSVDDKEGCRDCEWKYWCSGGCPLVTYRATGRYDVPSPHCRLYKAIYPEIMRLEGLRLLKYGSAGLL
jgi:uncharacterized protein